MDDTIMAISTAVGISAINIIRLSGKDSIKIVNSIFKGHNLTKAESHTIHYGYIVDENDTIDEVLVSIFINPKSFTRENMVEINCHGGAIVTNRIFELLLTKGVRIAEPGEFTKRAFLNGRIDLVEAEAIQDLIESSTENARKMNINAVKGNLSKLIKSLKSEVLKLLANIEVNIDYPEYEDEVQITHDLLEKKCDYIRKKLEQILSTSEEGRIIKNGITIAIVGKPNVGKSSLLNNLINEEKAIVTEIAGTTRDVVEGSIILNGIKINLVDTAGIRQTDNKVEKIGIDKSYQIIEDADLILFVVDSSLELNEEEQALLKKLDSKKTIVVENKSDLVKSNKKYSPFKVVRISALNDEDLTTLKNAIIKQLELEKYDKKDFTYISNARQTSLIKECLKIIKEVQKKIKQGVEIDLIEIDIKLICTKLGEIIGESYSEELVNEIFKNFCLGK